MKKIKNNKFGIILTLVLIINVVRYLLWWKVPFSESAVFSIVNRFDCMMIGGLGAMLYESKSSIFIKIVDNKLSQFLAWLCIVLIGCNIKFVNAIVDTSIITIVSLVLIIGQINVKNRLVNLDRPIFNFIGKISYGIYVYHVLLIFLFSKLLRDFEIYEPYKIVVVYFLIIASTIFIAYFSYEIFEARFIKLKNKFAIIKSSSSKN